MYLCMYANVLRQTTQEMCKMLIKNSLSCNYRGCDEGCGSNSISQGVGGSYLPFVLVTQLLYSCNHI